MTQWTCKARTFPSLLFPTSTVQFAALASEEERSDECLTVRPALAALSWPQLNSSMEKTDSASHCECSASLQMARNWCQFTPEHPVTPH